MARLTIDHDVDATTATRLLAPRRDLLAEADAGEGSFVMVTGPFDHYERRVTVLDGAGTDRVRVRETISYRLAVPVWRPLFAWPVRRRLRGLRRDLPPWWAPPDHFDAATARTSSLLCLLALVGGYLGTVIGQTLTFAADEFGNSRADQGITFAAVRIGTVFTLVALALADRRGRRPLTVACAVAGCLLTIAGAAAPDLWTLGITQALARAASNGLGLLLGIMAVEVAPPRSRAYLASLLVLTAGLGSGMVLWVLPVAELGEAAWRIVYLVPAVFLVGVVWVARRLPETERFATTSTTRPRPAGADPHAPGTDGRDPAAPSPDGTDAPPLPDRIDRRRLVLVAATSFAVLFFAAPASQFEADFLRDERGFSAGQISLFTLLTATPAAVGVAIGGRLADTRGRRAVGTVALAVAIASIVVRYEVPGATMWAAALVGTVVGGMVAPVLGVYNAELFGTATRGRANGIVAIVTVAGSAAGLLLVGFLADAYGSYGPAFATVAPLPLAVAAVIWLAFPETANRTLEEINAPAPTPARKRRS